MRASHPRRRGGKRTRKKQPDPRRSTRATRRSTTARFTADDLQPFSDDEVAQLLARIHAVGTVTEESGKVVVQVLFIVHLVLIHVWSLLYLIEHSEELKTLFKAVIR